MSTPDADDHFADLLAAHNQALAEGAAPPPVPEELAPRLERAQSCLQRLARRWPHPSPAATNDGAADHTAPDLSWLALERPTLPAQLGRFTLLRELGRGGEGVVFLASDPRLGRQVALKVPRPEVLVSPSARARFVREARAAAGLDHPNIVAVFEAGEEGPVAWIASAYCEGPTLAAWLKSRAAPVPVREAAALVAALADGVEQAHRHGILHRDLKPANILLQERTTETQRHREDRRENERKEEGQPEGPSPSNVGSAAHSSTSSPCLCASVVNFLPKITDFGLAKLLDGEAGMTTTGAVRGTPRYMAPEQVEGSKAIGPAVDIYALGTLLYEVLSGRAPFLAGTDLGTLRLVVTEEPLSPRRLRSDVPADLEAICLKCLEKDQRRRYPTAAALAEDLRRFLQGQPTHARPLGPGGRALKWVRRRPAVAALLAVSILAILGALLGVGWHAVELEKHNTQLEQLNIDLERLNTDLRETALREQSERSRAEAQTQLARRQLHVTRIRAAASAWENGRLLQMVEWLQDCPPEDRGLAWHELWRQGRRQVRLLATDTESGCLQVLFSPDGQSLAVSDRFGRIELWDPAAERRRAVLRGHVGSVRLAMAPDSRTLASTGPLEADVILWDLATGRERTRLPPHPNGVWNVAFSPDSQTLAVARRDQPLELWNWAAGRVRLRLPMRPGGAKCVAFSPDGTTLAVGYDEPLVRLYDVVTGRQTRALTVKDRYAGVLAWSPDGTILAAGGRDGTAHLFALTRVPDRSHRTIRVDDRSDGSVRELAFAPDGQTLVTAGGDHIIKFWNVATGQAETTLPQLRELDSVAYWPDGRWVACAKGREVVLYALQPEPEPPPFAKHGKGVMSVAFAPGGRTLATASEDQTVTLWDPTTGQKRGVLPHDSPVYAVAFAPDGYTLASGCRTGQVNLWDVATGEARAKLTGHTDRVWRLAFSPDGRMVASAGRDGKVRLWDAATGAARAVLHGHPDQVRSLAFTPDGRTLISGSKAEDAGSIHPTVLLWNPVTGQFLRGLLGLHVEGWSLAVSPDGQTLVLGDSGGTLYWWDLATDQLVANLRGPPGYVHGAAFTPDGRTLATSHSKVLVLWDVATRQEMVRLTGHNDTIYHLAMAPDGRTVATVGVDGEVRLWGEVGGKSAPLWLEE
jgi:WD40 repeat protein/serine/threonine protein kinase